MVAPFLLAIIVSLSPASEVFSWPPTLIPSSFHPENYVKLLDEMNFGRYLLNSTIVSVVSTVSVVLTSAMAGYAFARLEFPGRSALFLLILVTVMIPIQVTMIPLFILMRQIPLAGGNDLFGQGGTGWLNTYPGIILPTMATTFGVFMMRQFFQTAPRALLEAARIDGCSEFKIFARIYFPIAKPALFTVALFTFTEVWNSFLWPLIVASSTDMKTLQVGLAGLKRQNFTEWHLLMAGVVITALPPFLVFLFGHKYFARGVAISGLKG